jgi:uncharacterized membrane-anchored protein
MFCCCYNVFISILGVLVRSVVWVVVYVLRALIVCYAADSTDPLTYTVVTLIYILCTYYLKMVTDRGRNM